nr:hypothetical protein [Pseudomonadota bacterium]
MKGNPMNHLLTPSGATRHEFFLGSGSLVIAASLPWVAGSALAQAGAGGKPALVPGELDSWVAIHPDGRATAYYGKVDLGQG